jgi:hypothetical protein
VGHHDLDGRLTVFTNSGWRAHLRGGADIEITHHGRRRPVHADLDEDPGSVATVYHGSSTSSAGTARRRLGLGIHVGRTPTRDELEPAARDSGLSVITLTAR